MWHTGETRYIYSQVESDDNFTIDSATCTVYDSNGEIVTSGVADINNNIMWFLFTPSEAGIYVAVFNYVIGLETFESLQVIEVLGVVG